MILDLTGPGGSLANCSPVLVSHAARSWQLEEPCPTLHFGSDSTHCLASAPNRRHLATPLSVRLGGLGGEAGDAGEEEEEEEEEEEDEDEDERDEEE